ncbi:hypothetical protein N7E70_021390 [Aminobacter sp. NyZ550]|jgi:hypothetical protein|uniref:Uncharacterized protein n=1 Tax=Aminobacter ciceronei TaxID=150723 RepID=A0ABR6C2E8_9HYPH|nr:MULTISPECIES: hypothetical protein [Aminobacter]WMC98963.1 hypothetical protein RAR13_09815 [Aminobacter aminovorans]MBA8905544.1 hypothetical protein [Aminobacter ciceronei]MBA9019157.1 hypothetical protein [Aminobacter ciceronei]MRX37207.1 hypothetical protein [Aminobacter sp. MDW-2]QNH33218.1 hypothetical protein H5P29_22290 [Aminobacter sp. MDW-2]
MTDRSTESQPRRDAAAIDIWDNEGGAPYSIEHQVGRRIEADRSWTVYHVFTGIPVNIDGQAMTGLTRSRATSGMIFLNLRNTGRHRGRSGPEAFGLSATGGNT